MEVLMKYLNIIDEIFSSDIGFIIGLIISVALSKRRS